MSTEQQASSAGPVRREPLWADVPWRASGAIAVVASLLQLIIILGPGEPPRQLGEALGAGFGALLWSALFLGWRRNTRRWLPTAVLSIAFLSLLAAGKRRYEQTTEPHPTKGYQIAIEAGLEDWSNLQLQIPDIQRKLEDMTVEQREAYRQGTISGYIRDLENAKTNRNFANEMIARSGALEQKLEAIFGSEQAFNEAVKRFELEASTRKTGGYVGGSTTARHLLANAAPGEEAAEEQPSDGLKVDSTSRLTYRFKHPTKTPLELAKAGLPSFDGELLSTDLERGDSVAEITGRVRAETWARNPEVWGQAPGGEPQVSFGPVRTYLAGDPRFHILVKPARCAGCEGIQEVIFLRYKETGYLVGRPLRQPR